MPQRRPLSEISGNRPEGHELTVNDRAQIIGAIKCGVSIADAARTLDFPPSTVKTTIRRDSVRSANATLPRSGRPSKASARDIRTIIRYVRINPKHTYRQIRQELQLSFSSRTVKRIIEPFHIRKWQCKQRPELSEEVAKLRYERVLLRKDWSTEEWALIIFSDESSVERGKGGQREWAWRTANQKWSPQFVQTYSKGHDISIMVWGAIWIRGRSDLVVMTRDEHAKRNGYSANSYIDVLDQTIERYWQPGMIFMQDNAPIHTAKKVLKWFKERAIPVLD
jgi:transposase